MNLLTKRITILVLSLYLTLPVLDWTTHTVNAEVNQPVVGTEANADIVPGKVMVKYKRAAGQNSNSFMARSTNPLLKTIQFDPESSVFEKIAELRRDPNVEYAEPVYKVYASGGLQFDTVTQSIYNDVNNPEYMHNWGKTVTGLKYAASVTALEQLEQVTVAVVDTGADLSHPDLIGSIDSGYDFVNHDADPQDDNGHGTNVAGIIAAAADDGTGYTGVAPGVKIMPIKALNAGGEGSTDEVVQGIQYAIDHHADIINLSLGSSDDSKAMHDVIRHAVQQGILVVAAAGNESNNWIHGDAGQIYDPPNVTVRKAALTNYPAFYDEVISVGAVEQLVDTSLTAADFSNLIKIDVAAPGVNIYSTYLDHSYAYMSGTSQAAPFVSGFAALLKANNPALDASRLRGIIQNSASISALPDLRLNYVNVGREINVHDLFGYGLINGKKPFEKGNLHIVPDLSRHPSDNSITLGISAEDHRGTLQSVTSQVYLAAKSYREGYSYRGKYDLLDVGGLDHPIDLVNGVGHITFTLPLPDTYHYEFYIEDPFNQNYLTSNSLDITSRPAAPVPNLVSGSYTGAQNISLTSATPNAQLYYSLYNDSSSGVERVYDGPIAIDRNSILATYSIKNHIYSEDAYYYYDITPAPVLLGPGNSSGGGRGGGGGGFPQEIRQPSTDERGNEVLVLKPDSNSLLNQANSSETKEVVIDATTEGAVDGITLDLTGDVIQKANENKKPVVIKGDEVQVTFPPNTFDVNEGSANVQFQASISGTEATDIPAYAARASKIYDFNLTVNGNKVTSFHTPVKVTLTYDPAKVQDPDKLGVYYDEEPGGSWAYVGGTINNDGTIDVLLPHFSKYTVLEYKKTFDDIQNHWAMKEIEILAAKQIVNGLTDQSFAPEASVTRAQFVAILTRALKLTDSTNDHTFNDVADDAWYRDAVYAAYRANIVNGLDEHTFAPEDPITREQMATLLVNAYVYEKGMKLADLTVSQEAKYTDEDAISGWAKANVQYASGLGLVNGSDHGMFMPSGKASRAQASVVIYRILELINKQ